MDKIKSIIESGVSKFRALKTRDQAAVVAVVVVLLIIIGA